MPTDRHPDGHSPIDSDVEIGVLTDVFGIGERRVAVLRDHGYETVGDLQRAAADELAAIDEAGFGHSIAKRIKEHVGSVPRPAPESAAPDRTPQRTQSTEDDPMTHDTHMELENEQVPVDEALERLDEQLAELELAVSAETADADTDDEPAPPPEDSTSEAEDAVDEAASPRAEPKVDEEPGDEGAAAPPPDEPAADRAADATDGPPFEAPADDDHPAPDEESDPAADPEEPEAPTSEQEPVESSDDETDVDLPPPDEVSEFVTELRQRTSDLIELLDDLDEEDADVDAEHIAEQVMAIHEEASMVETYLREHAGEAAEDPLEEDVLPRLLSEVFRLLEIVREATDQLEAVHAATEAQDETLESLEASQTQLQETVTDLQSATDSIDDRLAAVHDRSEDQADDLAALEESVDSIDDRFVDLREAHADLRDRIATLHERDEDLREELRDIRSTDEELRADLDDLLATTDDIQQVLEALNESDERTEALLDELQGEVTALRNRTVTLEDEPLSIRSALHHLHEQHPDADAVESLVDRRIDERLEAVNERLDALEAETTADQPDRDPLEDLQEQVAEIRAALGLPPDMSAEYESAELQSLRNELQELRGELAEGQQQAQAAESADLRDDVRELERENRAIKELIEGLHDRV